MHADVVAVAVAAAVLTCDGCITFVDLMQCCMTGRLQLTAPGCRAVSFSTDPRANTMGVVCSDGMLRLFDLSAVRAKQQGQTPVQLARLQQVQLLQLSTSADPLPMPSKEGCSVAAPARGSKVLSDVGNIEHGSRTGRGQAVGPAAAASNSTAAGAAGQQLRVRQLGEPAASLNRRKLQEILLAYGEFPIRYRRLIW